MFWRKRNEKVSRPQLDKLRVGYDCAIEEIDALLGSLDSRSSENVEANDFQEILKQCRSEILTSRKKASADGSDFSRLADRAQAMEAEVARIAEAVWGYDEARVSGLLMAWAVLETNANNDAAK